MTDPRRDGPSAREDPVAPAWLDRALPQEPLPIWTALGGVLAGLIVATGSRVMLNPVLGAGEPFITYFPVVMVVSIWGGLLPGVLSAAASALLAAVFFLHPTPFSGANLVALGAFGVSSAVQVVVGAALSRAIWVSRLSVARARTVEDQLRTIVTELGHRAKNGMMVAMSIVSQSARAGDSAEDCARIINSRFGAMAKAQEVVIDQSGKTAELLELLTTIIAPFDEDRFDFVPSEPQVMISSEVAIGLALLINELATNAVKYGALSNDIGRVAMSWTHEGDRIAFVWEERGGPPVVQAAKTGFGTRLIQVWLKNGGGTAKRTLELDGAVCHVTFPISQGDG